VERGCSETGIGVILTIVALSGVEGRGRGHGMVVMVREVMSIMTQLFL